MPERGRSVAARLAAMLFVLLAQGCGPGTGGTGLPPAPGPIAPASTSATLTVGFDRPADLAGPIEQLDATVIRIAGTDLPRDLSDLLFDDGGPATADALRVGVEAQAWRVGERWRVAIRR